MIKLVTLSVLTFIWLGCSQFAIEQKVIGSYYLIATDSNDELNLSYREPNNGNNYGTIIDATIFAICVTQKCIIVKQHPRIFPNHADEKVVNYFILPLREVMDWKSKNGLLGPLTFEQFNAKIVELNISKEIVFKKID